MQAFGNQMSKGECQKDATGKGIGQTECQGIVDDLFAAERNEPARHINTGQQSLKEYFPYIERQAIRCIHDVAGVFNVSTTHLVGETGCLFETLILHVAGTDIIVLLVGTLLWGNEKVGVV